MGVVNGLSIPISLSLQRFILVSQLIHLPRQVLVGILHLLELHASRLLVTVQVFILSLQYFDGLRHQLYLMVEFTHALLMIYFLH